MHTPTIFGREPVMYLALLNAALALAIGFGLDLSPAQTGLIVAFVSAALGFVARSQVTPVAGPAGLSRNGFAKAAPGNEPVAPDGLP